MPEPKLPKWRVVSQTETIQPDQTGRFTQGVIVTFQTETGLTGSIFVPAANYNPEYVKDAIIQKVKLMAAVQELQG